MTAGPLTDHTSISGLIVLLPVVAAIAGAFFGAVATGLVRAVQDRQARNRERKGLLDLVHSELKFNFSIMAATARIKTVDPCAIING